jgi:hypothetical protein
MRKRIAKRVRDNALRGVLAFLFLLLTFVLIVAADLWLDHDRPSSLTAFSMIPAVALAIAAVLAYQQNAKLVRATHSQAIATTETAKEMLKAREWQQRPHLVITRRDDRYLEPGQKPSPNLDSIVVKNIGQGPAQDVRLAGHQVLSGVDKWLSQDLADLSPHDSSSVNRAFFTSGSSPAPDRYCYLVDDIAMGERQAVLAACYSDSFGTDYRSSDVPEHGLEVWRGGALKVGAPVWVWRGAVDQTERAQG